MKFSNYNIVMDLEEDYSIIYNTYSKEYIVYNKSESSIIKELMDNLVKRSYNVKEINCLVKLLEKGIVLKKNINELEKLNFQYLKERFNSKTLRIKIQTNLDCNIKCDQCHFKGNTHISNDTLNNILKFINNNMGNYNKIQLVWCGGEPLLKANQILNVSKKIVDLCENNNIALESRIITNGYLFNEDIIKNLKSIKLKNVHINLPLGSRQDNEALYTKYMRSLYKAIISNIKKILDNSIDVKLTLNITRLNYDILLSCIKFIPLYYRKNIDIKINLMDCSKDIPSAYELHRYLIDQGFSFDMEKAYLNHCPASNNNFITINPDGKVVPCPVSSSLGYYYGHISDQGEFIISEEELYYRHKNMALNNKEKCINCAYLPLHSGNCAMAKENTLIKCPYNNHHFLNPKEKILLHYYNDLKHKENFKENILEL
ncbi:radical SAM/SPASM domain-containing protein [Desnuesiella massiliensis]|uniref:radical SAM/SPASM domain-containing protein n=1 Tax=Desnuesiella massiliensis TaxID=1650662 RepID=UPI0018A83DC2|nr:radical SAM protein [Desnuesiella massiliensis]